MRHGIKLASPETFVRLSPPSIEIAAMVATATNARNAATTARVLREADEGRNLVRHGDVDALFADLGIADDQPEARS